MSESVWMRPVLSVGLCGLSLLLSSTMANAENVPVLASIPDDFHGGERALFTQQRQTLQNQLAELKAAAATYNAKTAENQTDAELSKVDGMTKDYIEAANAYNEDLATEEAVINGINAMAKRMGWSAEKQVRLNVALNNLSLVHDRNVNGDLIRSTWHDVVVRSQDAELIQEASQDGGLGFPGAGKQSLNDCAVFALANAAGLPYGVVAARANLIVSQGEWRSADESANPEKTIQSGLNGGETIMLAESFGQAEMVASSDFAKTLKAGRPIMVNLNISTGHEAVLTKTFQHGGETWYVMMDSNQNPDQRRFLSAKELNTLLKENGVAFSPDTGTTPKLLRDAGSQ